MSTSAVDSYGLKDRVCVVTGGGSGIGRATAIALAAAGARIAVLDRNAEGGNATLEQIERAGGSGTFVSCDTSSPASVEAAAAHTAKALGPCAVLVNNAGIIRAGALESLTLEEWNALLSVNLTGYFLCSQSFGRQMRAAGKGALIHIASVASDHPTPGGGAYSVAKAAVTMLSRQLAIEWGPYGIRSNCVKPGFVLTAMTQSTYDQPGVTERRSEAVPARRIGNADDIAQTIVFLASERASYISGEEITVDGGFSRMLMALIPRGSYQRTTS